MSKDEFEPEAYCKSIKDELLEFHGDGIVVRIVKDVRIPFGDIVVVIKYGPDRTK